MVKIISDSTCDLSPELLERYHVQILPLHVILGEGDFLDGVNVTPDDIYRWSDENNASPKTAACSLEDAVQVLEPHVQSGHEVIVFTISASMSSTNQVIHMAVDQLEAEHLVHVIDSASLSTGVGLQVIEAAEMAAQGASAQEIVAHLEAIRPLVRASFVVDTLVYLHRGGRCGSVSAMVGGMLRLHPRITVADGKMSATKKYRGKMDSVIRAYVADLEEELRTAKADRVFITHSGCDADTVQSVRACLEGLGHFTEIHETRAGGVVSCHCGPGTLGVIFIAHE